MTVNFLRKTLPKTCFYCRNTIDWVVSCFPVQLLSCIRLFATPWTAAHQASLSITNSQSLPKSMSIESVMPSNHLILCHPLLLLPSIFPSIRVFSNESALRIRWPKYWSFSFNISPFNEHPGLVSFRMDWLDLLTVQGTLKNLLLHHSSKASIGSDRKVSAYNVGHLGSIPGWGRSSGEGNGNPLQYSCLENHMDGGALGYSPWGCKESDTTKRLHTHSSLYSPTLTSIHEYWKNHSVD